MIRKFNTRSLKNMEGIHPDLRRVLDRALQDSPVQFTVIEGLRTIEKQKENVANGASQTMNSRHITGHAVDLMPLDANGKAAFDWKLYDQLAPAIKAAAALEGVAIVWGGDWKTFKDGPHFELDRRVYPAKAARKSAAQSTTMQAGFIQVASAGAGGVTAVSSLSGTAQIVALVLCGVIVLAAAWIMRERLRKWVEGDR
jgi:peptidoglycan L-alanyl-D-glutamate endopeptidase CwlK